MVVKRSFIGLLALALVAVVVFAVPDRSRPAFAAVEDLDSQGTGFPCSDGDGRGGIPYQHVWGGKPDALIDEDKAKKAGTDGIQWQLGGYNPSTEEYDVVGTWSPYVDGGLTDGNSTLISKDKFEKKGTMYQVNGLVMDPYGNAYVAVMPKSGSAYYVQLLPDSDGDDLGEMRAIAKLSGATDINGGTYIEEGGEPYALLSNDFLGKTWKVDLVRADNDPIPTVTSTTIKGTGSSVKDYSWVKEGITYDEDEYNLVGLQQTGSEKGTIWLQHSDHTNEKAVEIKDVVLPKNTKGSGETFGASYNFKFEDDKTYLYFSANKVGELVKIELPDPNGNGDIEVDGPEDFVSSALGGTTETSNNDGAGCPYEPPPVAGKLSALTWPPDCVLDNPTGEGSIVPITIFNNNDGGKTVEITATIDGTNVGTDEYTSEKTLDAYPELDNAEFDIPGKDPEGKSGKVKLFVDIVKDEVWAVTVTHKGTPIPLIPNGGTLNADSCGGPFEDPAYDPEISFGACTGEEPDTTLAATIDNSDSEIEVNWEVTVGSTFIENGTVSKESVENITIPISHDQEATITVSADGENDVTGTHKANCPAGSTIEAYDCVNHSGLIQTRENNAGDGYDVVLLDPANNAFDVIWEIPLTITGDGDDEFTWLNGTAIDPTSGVAYGIMSFKDTTGEKYLVRFDEETVEYLYELDMVSSAGTFDADGNFYWWQHTTTGNTFPATLWTITDPGSATGYADRNNAGVDLGGVSIGGGTDQTWSRTAADITHVEADFGDGVKDYVIGLGGGFLSVTDVAGATAYEFNSLEFADGSGLVSTAYGAAYTIYDGAGNVTVYFSSNDLGFIATLDLSTVNVGDESQTVLFNDAGDIPNSNVNDGMACPITVASTPTQFGDVFGYVWVDFNDDGLRSSIEDGAEPHVTDYSVTFTNANEYKDSAGNIVHQPGGMERTGKMKGSDTGDYRWEANLPCKDNSGIDIDWIATFDYTNVSNWPTGFTPDGYTIQTNAGSITASEVDSDGKQSSSEKLFSDTFNVTCGAAIQSTTHRVDAGVVGNFTFTPTVTVDISCATTVDLTLDNTASSIDSTYVVNVYRVDASGNETLMTDESASQIVSAGATATFTGGTGITLPPSDVRLYLVIEGQGTLNGAVNADKYNPTVLNQSANDGVNSLCVQVQAEMDCASGGEQVTLDNTASNQEATFTITPVVNGETKSAVPQVVAAGATVTLTNTVLAIPEDSTWTIKWEVTGSTAGSFDETELDEELEKDCIDPVWNPSMSYTLACAANGQVLITYTIDNSASTQYDTTVDPSDDRYAAHAFIVRYGGYQTGTTVEVPPGESDSGTFLFPENSRVEVWLNESSTQRPNDEGNEGSGYLEDVLYVEAGNCPDWEPAVTIDFECGIRNTAELDIEINNSATEVDIRYKLVAADYLGNETTVKDWQNLPAGFADTIFLSQTVDRNMNYSVVVESTESHPNSPTAPSGWGTATTTTYTSCTGTSVWDPLATITIECGASPPELNLYLDNQLSDFHAEYTVNVFDGPSSEDPKNNGLSSTQIVPEGGYAGYNITIPVPDPGEMITIQVLVTALTTGGVTITETSEIWTQAAIDCPLEIALNLTTAEICGAQAQGIMFNNESSGADLEILLTQYLDGIPNASTTVTVPAGEERQEVLLSQYGHEWEIEWQVTKINGESVSTSNTGAGVLNALPDFNGTIGPATFSSEPSSNCPMDPLFTG
ncbi:MAG: hypothetical protein VYD77_03370 [Actinomycetota bacterium]|nr:hypothetical protein [Actinomycetota bacterium]